MHPALQTAVAALIPSLLALGGYRYLAASDAWGLCAAAFAAVALIAVGARTSREV
jgi:hypothetical protein